MIIHNKKICIIGAGLSGLSAAYDLGRNGYEVLVLESSKAPGGLASSIEINGRLIERFYHFICKGDKDLINLISELNLNDKMHWQQSNTGFYYNGSMYRFSKPIELIRFKPVPLFQRIRFGVNIVQNRYIKSWEKLDKRSAYSWLNTQIGKQAYEVIWDPLLRIKFGDYFDQISAAWIWHRVHRVASSRRHIWEPEYLGYLEYGSETVIEALLNQLNSMPNVDVKLNAEVRRLHIKHNHVFGISTDINENMIPCDSVISTAALPILLKIVREFDQEYISKLQSIDYLGVVCGLLKLKKSISKNFWVNVNDPHIPFNGIIEYSNLNKHLGLGEKSILYIPYYLRVSDSRYSFSDEELLGEFSSGLNRINPDFQPDWIEECFISRAKYAQAICTVGFKEKIPDHRTPVDGLYITDSTQFYPEDRTISAAIRLGRNVAAMIDQEYNQNTN